MVTLLIPVKVACVRSGQCENLDKFVNSLSIEDYVQVLVFATAIVRVAAMIMAMVMMKMIMMLMMVNLLMIIEMISRKYQANHPVHIMDTTGNISPSAFIPFCAWACDMEALGTRVPNFSVPVCNAFRPR